MSWIFKTPIRNSIIGLAAQLAIKALSFIFSVVIVRHLGAAVYGQYAAVLAFGAVFVFLSDLGLSTYTVREVARLRGADDGAARIAELYGAVLRLRLPLAVLTAGLLIGTAWLTGRPPAMVGAIALGTIGLLMYSVQGTADAVLAGFERLDLSAGAKVLNQLVFVLAGAIALLAGLGYYGLIVANLLGVALMTHVCWQATRSLGASPRYYLRGPIWSLLRASLPMGIIGFTLGLSYKFDSVLLDLFRGDAETGYYNAAYNLVFSAVVISNVLNTALYPSLTRQAAMESAVLPGIYQRMLRYLLMLSLPIAVGTCLLADQIVHFLFSSAYTPSIAVLRLIIWVTPLMFTSEFLGYIVIIHGNEDRAARAVMISTGANVLLNLLLIPRLGLLAAALMTLLTEAILVGQYLWMLRSVIARFDWTAVLLRPLAAAAVMGCAIFPLRSLPLPLVLMGGVLTYGGMAIALGLVGREEIAIVRSLRGSPNRPAPVTAPPLS
ncbi:MAG: flippase [Chloroflexi bacterium]|nr:flippase [Chloroflexota bacterium]